MSGSSVANSILGGITRRWGTGVGMDYARELCRRTTDALRYDS